MGRKNKKKKKNYNTTNYSTTSVSTVPYWTTKSSAKDSEPNFDRKGKLNETKFPDFIKICKFEQMDLKHFLIEELLLLGYKLHYGDGYVYAQGTIPVLLTAHMDTVHKDLVTDFYEYYDKEKDRHIISSPQGIGGDDRCGVYMILEIIKTHKCSVLFCEDEECGGIGSYKFCKEKELIKELSELNYLIELDRMNGNDAVYYDCENYDFTDFIEENTGYMWEWGSFSDISNLSPECGIASVNLSCGYYNAHKTSEYVVVEEMMNTIEVVKKLLDTECKEQFEYIEADYNYGNYDYSYLNSYGTYGKEKNANKTKNSDEDRTILILFDGFEDGGLDVYASNAKSVEEAFGKFFMENSTYCYSDVLDYEVYENRILEDGWYDSKTI